MAAGTRGTERAAVGAIGHPRERAGVIRRLGRGGPYMAGVIGRPQERAGSHGSELEAQPWWAASHNAVGGGLGHGGPVRTAGTVEGSALAGGGGGGLGHDVTLGGASGRRGRGTEGSAVVRRVSGGRGWAPHADRRWSGDGGMVMLRLEGGGMCLRPRGPMMGRGGIKGEGRQGGE